MEIIIRGDKLKITDAMKDYVHEKMGKLDKYLENSDSVRATVVAKVRNHKQSVEITIPLNSLILRSEEEQNDIYAAVDVALDKLERQIRKNKTKLMARQNKVNKSDYDFVFAEFEEIPNENKDKVIKRKQVEVKPMDEEEAILQMELLGHQFYMFKDSESMKPVVIYKRNAGGYGVIEAE